MNRKGFTLIELLATLLLLSVIVVISFVSINKITQKSKDNDCETIVNNIKSAVKEYASDYRYDNSFNRKITVSDLISNNYLSGKVMNPYNKSEDITDSIELVVNFNNDYTVSSVKITGPDFLAKCDK